MGSIVVGVDESDAARDALRWAVEAGARRGWSVTALLAWSYLDQHEDADVTFRPDYTEQDAVAALARLVSTTVADADVDEVAVCDLPARALLEAADGADLVVVGARGMGGLKAMALGSVSQQVVHHSPVPVAVVRRPADTPAGSGSAGAVVGVDGSDGSLRALRWALEDALAGSFPVTIVHASNHRHFTAVRRAGRTPDASVITDAVARCGLPDLPPIETVEVDDSAANALLTAAAGASHIVVGSRGHGGFRGLRLGSVSQHVLNHATGVVVVVPPDQTSTA